MNSCIPTVPLAVPLASIELIGLLDWVTVGIEASLESIEHWTADWEGEAQQTITEKHNEYDSRQQTDCDVQGPVLEPVESSSGVWVEVRCSSMTYHVVDPEPNPVSRCWRLVFHQSAHFLRIVMVSATETSYYSWANMCTRTCTHCRAWVTLNLT